VDQRTTAITAPVRAGWLAGLATGGRYAVAVGATLVALGVKQAFAEYLEPTFILFYPAVMLAAVSGGVGPGLVATILSALLAAFWVIPSQHGAMRLDVADGIGLAVFASMGAAMSIGATLYRRQAREVARLERERELQVAEERARRGELEALHRYEVLATNSRDIILFVRADDGRILEANAAAALAYGYSADELRNLTLRDLRAPEHGESVVRDLEQADANGVRVETTHQRRDGTTFPVEASTRAVTLDGSRVLLSIVRDITARRQAEAALRESLARLADERERLAVTLRSIGDAVIATDQASRVTLMNGVAEALTGWSAAEAVGRALGDVFRIVTEETGKPSEDPVARVLREGSVVGLANSTLLIARDGTERPIADSGAPIRDATGVIYGVVLVFRDQSAERHAERSRREAEARLARSERRYRLLADHSNDVIWTLDLFTRHLTYVSPSIRILRGLTVEEARGETIEQSLTIESRARLEAMLARLESGDSEDLQTGVYDQRCKDGTVKHVEITTVAVRDALGRPVEIVGVSRDASARVKAQRALSESEELYRSLFQLAPNGVVLLDDRGGIVAFNDQAYRQLGYGREEFARLRVSDIDPEEPDPETVAEHLRRIADRGSEEFEALQRTRSGEIRNVIVNSRPVQVAGKRLFLAVWQDVTERWRAEEALRQSEERFRALIERSTDLIQVLDAEGRVQFWSQSSTEALGWTAEEMIGRRALDLVHEADRRRVGSLLQALLREPGATARDTFRLQHRDGTWRQVESVARNLLHDPAVRGVVVNSRDMTAQHSLEQQLRQSQKLESLGRLAGGVAHDFNNILTVILGCAEALKRNRTLQTTEVVEDVDEIAAAGGRARDLTRQLLAFARKQVIAPVPLDLGSVVRGCQKMLARLLGEDVELRVELEPAPWTMHADPSQIEQILFNLAVNARDAMPTGGQLVITTRNRTVTVGDAQAEEGLQPGDWVQLLVGDTGVGMSPEVQAHLFEPFFTTKEQGKGTGLGLAMVYGIVTQVGGHVHVKSEPESGTVVQMCFPRVSQAAVSPTAAAAPASVGGTESILVVEDDPQVRWVVVRTLRAEGYRVQAVDHPRQALEIPPEELGRTDLLVTDVIMPEIDGHALAAQLTGRCSGLRVLYLSGYPGDVLSKRGVLDSGIEFLGKPFTGSGLLQKVRAILDARKPGAGR
jgi:PAS domain S-box-containing protein